MLTFGGPQTTPEHTSEAGIGLGTGATLFKDAHTGGLGYMLRYKYGLTAKYDLGIDAVGIARGDKSTYTIKVANRYRLSDNWRLEMGGGAADDSDGKSLNADLGITWGTIPEGRPWNIYSSFRLGGALGYAGDVLGKNEGEPLPNTLFSLFNLGTQGRISERQKFIFEGGYGYVFPEGANPGPIVYLSGGLIFYVGKAL